MHYAALLLFRSHLPPFIFSVPAYLFFSPLHSPCLSTYSSPMTFTHSPSMPLDFSADVHQGETDHSCDEGGARWHQEQGDSCGCRYGGHGLRHERPAQGKTKR